METLMRHFISLNLGCIGLTLLSSLFMSKAGYCVTDAEFQELKTKVEGHMKMIGGSIPIGTILPFAGNRNPPDGFLPCDGRWVSKSEYKALFDVIGHEFSDLEEVSRHSGDVQLPDLRGRTVVGEYDPNAAGDNSEKVKGENGEEIRSCEFGTWQGNDSIKMTINNLPPHQHSGNTDSNNNSTTTNETTEDYPDHSHSYIRHNMGVVPIYNGVHLNHSGSHHNIADNGSGSFATAGANTRHKHKYNLIEHQHPFTTSLETEKGWGHTAEPINVLSPATVVRFIIKAK